MRKPIALLWLACLSLLGAGTVLAAGLPWQNHSRPYDFLFGNYIDMYQPLRHFFVARSHPAFQLTRVSRYLAEIPDRRREP